jgi:hypothetical protein
VGKGLCFLLGVMLLFGAGLLVWFVAVIGGWLDGPPRPTPREVEEVRQLAIRIREASHGESFFYDCHFKKLQGGTEELGAELDSVVDYKLIYPLLEGGAFRAIVLVTYTDTCYTTGYLVTTSSSIPDRHRPGPFMRLNRMDRGGKENIVYVFESR